MLNQHDYDDDGFGMGSEGYEEYNLEGEFREPAYLEENGLFTTEAQVRFFTNRPNGSTKLNAQCTEFQDYVTMCEIHNLVFDMSEKNNDEGFMYWDHTKGCIGYSIVKNGKIHTILDKAGIALKFHNNEDKNP